MKSRTLKWSRKDKANKTNLKLSILLRNINV